MTIADRLDCVLLSLDRALARSERDRSGVMLVAVSKKQPVTLMHEYLEAATARRLSVVFGENYVQELKTKRSQFSQNQVFHLIGPLQSNKIRDAVRHADVIQSVHSLSVLQGIADEAQKQGKQQRIFLQVNIGDDPNKSGFQSSEIPEILSQVAKHASSLSLVGLMTITPYYDEPEDARPDFTRMRRLKEELQATALRDVFEGRNILLSMGMSADFHIAIEEGADVVRVGTALFGERQA
jgi:pyridoxal phosphate enzyme (YggS family)